VGGSGGFFQSASCMVSKRLAMQASQDLQQICEVFRTQLSSKHNRNVPPACNATSALTDGDCPWGTPSVAGDDDVETETDTKCRTRDRSAARCNKLIPWAKWRLPHKQEGVEVVCAHVQNAAVKLTRLSGREERKTRA